MFPAALPLLRNVLRLILPIAVASTFYLYLYPIFGSCAFPLPEPKPRNTATAAFQETVRQHVSSSARSAAAPFRLLALGDPQLEGDTSLPSYYNGWFPHAKSVVHHLSSNAYHTSVWSRLRQVTHELVDVYFDDIPDALESVRKHIDLFGNDFYLAHIYRTLCWWAKPTHVAVLGDLLGSQWIQDAEFETRSDRFWNRSFRGGERVPDDVAAYPAHEYDVTGLLGDEVHGKDREQAAVWQKRIINVAGNHDIGYAGELTPERLSRFERAFGRAAYELRFELPLSSAIANATMFDPDTNPDSDRLPPELRIVNINNMNLDTPALDQSLQDKTYGFVNDVINTASSVEYKGHFTLVLTHIPLYKPEGLCVDAPYFTFHAGGGVKEQNQLSADASRGFLEGIFGLNGDGNAPGAGRGRKGVVVNGHDHEGCDTYHFINQTLQGDERQWQNVRWGDARGDGLPETEHLPGLREITVRSMMGQYGGNAGLLSVWFDEQEWEWKFEFATCALGRQYFWWFVHVIDLIALVGLLGLAVLEGIGLNDGVGETKPVKAKGVSAATSTSSSSITRAKISDKVEGQSGEAEIKTKHPASNGVAKGGQGD